MRKKNKISKRYGAYNLTEADHEPRNYLPILEQYDLTPEEIFLQVLAKCGPLYFINMTSSTTEQETAVAKVFGEIVEKLWPFALMPAYVEWCIGLLRTKQRLERNERRRMRRKQNRSA